MTRTAAAATRVIAHRGASGQRPENTLPAYALALEQGADMIEIDLHRTRDGAVVVSHDSSLEGLGGSGEIGKATLAEISRLDAGEGARVPQLFEVLEAFGTRIDFNLEIKRAREGAYPGLEAQVLEEVGSRGLLERMLFSCFFDDVLERLHTLNERARLAVLVDPGAPEGWLSRCRTAGAEAVNFHWLLASSENVERAHAAGLKVNVYTVDAAESLQALLERGVDGIFTNYPGRLRELLNMPLGVRDAKEPVRPHRESDESS